MERFAIWILALIFCPYEHWLLKFFPHFFQFFLLFENFFVFSICHPDFFVAFDLLAGLVPDPDSIVFLIWIFLEIFHNWDLVLNIEDGLAKKSRIFCQLFMFLSYGLIDNSVNFETQISSLLLFAYWRFGMFVYGIFGRFHLEKAQFSNIGVLFWIFLDLKVGFLQLFVLGAIYSFSSQKWWWVYIYFAIGRQSFEILGVVELFSDMFLNGFGLFFQKFVIFELDAIFQVE